MPIIALRCESCSHEYEALKSFSTTDESVTKCPSCGGESLTQLVAGAHNFRQQNVNLMDPDEIDSHLHVKRETESMAAKILSGEISIKEAGPKEFWPEVPESLKKRYY